MLTQNRLKELFKYDPETGIFIRIKKSAVNSTVGETPGCASRGYVRMMVDGVRYQAHRLAWLYVYGEFPPRFVDHINGNRADNRIANLRDVDKSMNTQNQRGARKDNLSTGLLGASFHKVTGKYAAQISINGKKISLGLFDTPEQAHAEYVRAKREIHTGNTL